MNLFWKYSSALASLAVVSPLAFASVAVSSPTSNTDVSPTFNLSASASVCSSQPVAAMGYSFDSSSDTTIIMNTWVNTSVVGPPGTHVLHVKAWGNRGASCVTDVTVTVVSNPLVPANAVSVSNIQAMSEWQAEYDTATNGPASGSTNLAGTPSLSGQTRQFTTNFTAAGGERYDVAFGDDTQAENFLYDGWVYLNGSISTVANLEFDMNQTMPNGETVIFGFQCDGYSSTWDYTANAGTPKNYIDTWRHSAAKCNVHNWSLNTWHHVQVSYSRDSAGNVTYKAVWLDGTEQTINATVPSAFALGWAPVLLTNFQVDGLGSRGTATVYLDNLMVYRW
jgi:hypothetical protein